MWKGNGNHQVQLRGRPTESTGSDAIGNPRDEFAGNGRIGGRREGEDEMRELCSDRFVVEGGEGGDERRKKKVRMECEKRLKEVRQ